VANDLPKPNKVIRPDVCFLAAGMSSPDCGFPIEVAICDDGFNLKEWQIAPHPSWGHLTPGTDSPLRNYFTNVGRPAAEVADDLATMLTNDQVVFVADIGIEAYPLTLLHMIAAKKPSYGLYPISLAAADQLGSIGVEAPGFLGRWSLMQQIADRLWQPGKRARSRALNLAATYRMMIDPVFAELAIEHVEPVA